MNFTVPKHIDSKDIIIQYVHIKWEPMEPEFYWIKTYNGRYEDTPHFSR